MIAVLLATLVTGISPLKIQIEGEGYLRFANEGRIVYAKSATLVVREGKLSEASGATIMPLHLVPESATSLQIQEDGTLSCTSQAGAQVLGRISLALFAPGEGLAPQGSYLAAKSRPRLQFPGETGVGKIITLGKQNSANQPIANPVIKATTNSSPPATTPASNLGVIVIPERVVLKSDRMTLDQFVQGTVSEKLLARLRLADFGPAPKSGNQTRIARARIETRILMAGIEAKDAKFQIPEVVEVCAPSQFVDPQAFIDAAKRAAADKLGTTSELKVEGTVQPYQAPIGTLDLQVDSVTQRGDQIAVNIAIFVDGKRINSKQILFTSELGAIVIKSGDLVRVEMRASGISVEINGRAKKAGRIGETIEVEVQIGEPAVKTSHLGRITGPGKVEVKL